MKNKFKSLVYGILWALPLIVFMFLLINNMIANRETGNILVVDDIISVFYDSTHIFKSLVIDEISLMPYEIFINVFNIYDDLSIVQGVFIILGWSLQFVLIRILFESVAFFFNWICSKLEV